MIIENKSKYLVQSMATLSSTVEVSPEESKLSKSSQLLDKFEQKYPVGNDIYSFEFDGFFSQEPRQKWDFSEEYWNELISKHPDMEYNGVPGDILKPSNVSSTIKSIDKNQNTISINFELQFFPPYYEGVNTYFGGYVYMVYGKGFDYSTKELSPYLSTSENKFYITNDEIMEWYKNSLIEKIIFINENGTEYELALLSLIESMGRLEINNFFDDISNRVGTRFTLKFILK